jgi:hypothetical protein
LVDLVPHCGDVAVGIDGAGLAERMPGLPRRVFLIRGNHDSRSRLSCCLSVVGASSVPSTLVIAAGSFASHKPLHPLDPKSINVHGHLHQHPSQITQHLNVSVERLDYRPRRLGQLLSELIDELDQQIAQPPGRRACSSNMTTADRRRCLPGNPRMSRA